MQWLITVKFYNNDGRNLLTINKIAKIIAVTINEKQNK